jgi:hypothetical protein
MESVPIEFVYIDYEEEDACAWVGQQSFFDHFWAFLARPSTRVKIRSELVEPVECRETQRRVTQYARGWMLEGGKRLFTNPSREPLV